MKRVTDTDALRYALGRAGRMGLTRIDMNNAVGSPNADRRFRELKAAGEAECYLAGKTPSGKQLYRYRLTAAWDLFGTTHTTQEATAHGTHG